MVATDSDILAQHSSWCRAGDQELPTELLAAVALHAQALAVGIAAVAREPPAFLCAIVYSGRLG